MRGKRKNSGKGMWFIFQEALGGRGKLELVAEDRQGEDVEGCNRSAGWQTKSTDVVNPAAKLRFCFQELLSRSLWPEKNANTFSKASDF